MLRIGRSLFGGMKFGTGDCHEWGIEGGGSNQFSDLHLGAGIGGWFNVQVVILPIVSASEFDGTIP